LDDLMRRSRGVNRQTGNRICQVKPGELAAMPPLESRVVRRSGPHQPGTHRWYTNALTSELDVQALRQSSERKLAGAVRKHVRHRDAATNGRDVHDTSCTSLSHIRQHGNNL